MYRPSGATHSALLLKTAPLLPLAPPLFGLTLDDRNRVTAVASNSQVAGRARRRGFDGRGVGAPSARGCDVGAPARLLSNGRQLWKCWWWPSNSGNAVRAKGKR